VAISARALAAAARRARQRIIVIDAFADLDTAACAEQCIHMPYGLDGFDGPALLAALDSLSARAAGLVYGAGFEHCPELLAKLGARVPLIGNPPELVATCKDPMRFAALLRSIGAPHPETTLERQGREDWLMKRIGGSGGQHIRGTVGTRTKQGFYYQRRAAGRPVSVLFAADGRRTSIVGYSEQWNSETAEAPFRFGGCATPASLPKALAGALARVASALVEATALRGVNSLDCLVDGKEFTVLEVNPRPGATFDLFDGANGLSLWRLHKEAVEGRLTPARLRPAPARAAAVLYAPYRLKLPRDFAWPSWASDRTRSGVVVERDEPFCTIRAKAATVAAARARLATRTEVLLGRLAHARIA
jgi:predicted ATP-grasp superfamily ATP-dependent carboligase